MDTRTKLAALLTVRSAPQVARLSGLSLKTVYRIRSGDVNTTFETAKRLMDAIKKVPPKAPSKKAAPKPTNQPTEATTP